MSNMMTIISGIGSAGIGLALAVWSSIKANSIRRHVAHKGLAPRALADQYSARFKFDTIAAAYVADTGKRSTIALIYLAGIGGIALFVAGGLIALATLKLPK